MANAVEDRDAETLWAPLLLAFSAHAARRDAAGLAATYAGLVTLAGNPKVTLLLRSVALALATSALGSRDE